MKTSIAFAALSTLVMTFSLVACNTSGNSSSVKDDSGATEQSGADDSSSPSSDDSEEAAHYNCNNIPAICPQFATENGATCTAVLTHDASFLDSENGGNECLARVALLNKVCVQSPNNPELTGIKITCEAN